MMSILGAIYKLFTKNVVTRFLGSMISNFISYLASSWAKTLIKPVNELAVCALSA